MKSILVLAPMLPASHDLNRLMPSLSFLHEQYNVTWYDPLGHRLQVSQENFTDDWVEKISKLSSSFDVFMGFSFGALLLLHCLAGNSLKGKKIVLFSAPSLLDEDLSKKLYGILDLLKTKGSQEAVAQMYRYVPCDLPDNLQTVSPDDEKMIQSRLFFGLSYILNNKFPESVKESRGKILQLVGQDSQLVKERNILLTAGTNLNVVVHSGMRVLDDNPAMVHPIIREYLDD